MKSNKSVHLAILCAAPYLCSIVRPYGPLSIKNSSIKMRFFDSFLIHCGVLPGQRPWIGSRTAKVTTRMKTKLIYTCVKYLMQFILKIEQISTTKASINLQKIRHKIILEDSPDRLRSNVPSRVYSILDHSITNVGSQLPQNVYRVGEAFNSLKSGGVLLT